MSNPLPLPAGAEWRRDIEEPFYRCKVGEYILIRPDGVVITKRKYPDEKRIVRDDPRYFNYWRCGGKERETKERLYKKYGDPYKDRGSGLIGWGLRDEL